MAESLIVMKSKRSMTVGGLASEHGPNLRSERHRCEAAFRFHAPILPQLSAKSALGKRHHTRKSSEHKLEMTDLNHLKKPQVERHMFVDRIGARLSCPLLEQCRADEPTRLVGHLGCFGRSEGETGYLCLSTLDLPLWVV